LNSNGKLDRHALPAPSFDASPGVDHVEPRTETEEALAEIWADVLGVDRVGVVDNFFQLGGDSIQSMLISSRANTLFDVSLSPRDVMTTQTVEALARVVEDHVLGEIERIATRGDDR
jgi:acyl carrier protein